MTEFQQLVEKCTPFCRKKLESEIFWLTQFIESNRDQKDSVNLEFPLYILLDIFSILKTSNLTFQSVQDSLYWWLADQQRPTCSDNYLLKRGRDNIAFSFANPGNVELVRFTSDALAENDPIRFKFTYVIETKQILLYVRSPEDLFDFIEHAVEPLKRIIYDDS